MPVGRLQCKAERRHGSGTPPRRGRCPPKTRRARSLKPRAAAGPALGRGAGRAERSGAEQAAGRSGTERSGAGSRAPERPAPPAAAAAPPAAARRGAAVSPGPARPLPNPKWAVRCPGRPARPPRWNTTSKVRRYGQPPRGERRGEAERCSAPLWVRRGPAGPGGLRRPPRRGCSRQAVRQEAAASPGFVRAGYGRSLPRKSIRRGGRGAGTAGAAVRTSPAASAGGSTGSEWWK